MLARVKVGQNPWWQQRGEADQRAAAAGPVAEGGLSSLAGEEEGRDQLDGDAHGWWPDQLCPAAEEEAELSERVRMQGERMAEYLDKGGGNLCSSGSL